MPNAFRTTPQLGPQIDVTYKGLPYWDLGMEAGKAAGAAIDPSYRLGNRESGSDGAVYLFVKASATIAATANTGTQVSVTVPGFTVATGSGGYYTEPGVAVAAGDFIHVRKGAHNAVPA